MLITSVGIALMISLTTAAQTRLDRGENGFQIGDSIVQLDKVAKSLKLTLTSAGREATREHGGGSRIYRAPSDARIIAYTMFLKDGHADSIDLVYSDTPTQEPSFNSLLESLKKRFGAPAKVHETRREEPIRYAGTGKVAGVEHQRLQHAFWCDGKTVVHLESRTRGKNFRELQVSYMDLPPGSSRSFGLVGYAGRSFGCSSNSDGNSMPGSR